MSTGEANEFLSRLIAQTRDPDGYKQLDRERLIRTAEANPLIIQWIMGQMDLAADLNDVLNELSQGEGDAAYRVFDHSFNLPQLNSGGRAVLLALSLFTPSASRPALAEVAGMNLSKVGDKKRFKKAQQALASLWLIDAIDGGSRLCVAGLTRELTRARLKIDQRAPVFRRRFVARLLRHAQAHAQLTPLDLNALEAEYGNLIAAVEIAFGLEDWKSVLKLTDVLVNPSSGGLLPVRGYWEEMLSCSERAIRAARALNDEHAAARFAAQASAIRMQRGEFDAARKTYQEALEVFRTTGSRVDVANALHQLGSLAREQGDLSEARRLYQESLQINRELHNATGIASVLHDLGRVAQNEANFQEARQLYIESLQLSKDIQNQLGIASILLSLGQLAQEGNHYEEAADLYVQSLELERRLGNQSGIANSLHSLGLVAERQGKTAEAKDLFREALSIFEHLGSPSAKRLREYLTNAETPMNN